MNRKTTFSIASLVTLFLSAGMLFPLVATMISINTHVSNDGGYASLEYVVYPFIFFAIAVIAFYMYYLARQIHEALVLSTVVWPLYLWVDLWLLNFTIIHGHRSKTRLGLEIASIAAISTMGFYLARKDRTLRGVIR